MCPKQDFSCRTMVLEAELVPGSRVIQKLSGAGLTLGADTGGTQQEPCGKQKGASQPQNKSELGPLHAHGMHVCKSTPSSERSGDARALGEQSPGSFSALFCPLIWDTAYQRYTANLRWPNEWEEEQHRYLLCQGGFGLYFFHFFDEEGWP